MEYCSEIKKINKKDRQILNIFTLLGESQSGKIVQFLSSWLYDILEQAKLWRQ